MLFAISPAPAARGVAGQMAFGLSAVPGRRPRGRFASKARFSDRHFGFEAAPAFFRRLWGEPAQRAAPTFPPDHKVALALAS